jgi:hypothetical protein
VDRDSYAERHTSTSTSSSTCTSHAADRAVEERDRQQDNMVQNRQHGSKSHAEPPAHLRDIAHKSLVYDQFV